MTADGRDSRGRFVAGCAGGPGRKPGRIHEIRSKLADAVTGEQAAEVMEHLRGLALGGDISAAKLWLAYAVGEPRHVHADATADATQAALEQALAAALTGELPPV